MLRYRDVNAALERTAAYYQDPRTPARLIQRLGTFTNDSVPILGENLLAVFGTGFPFWRYYTIRPDGTAPVVQETVAHVRRFQRHFADVPDARVYPCSTHLNLSRLDHLDLYRICRHRTIRPTIRDLLYVLPDGDLVFIVRRFPTQAVRDEIERRAARRGFFPLYQNLWDIIRTVPAQMALDAIFIERGPFVRALRSLAAGRGRWTRRTVPNLIIRHGTPARRRAWLCIGSDLAFETHPFLYRDDRLRVVFDTALRDFYARHPARELLSAATQGQLREPYTRLFREAPVVQSLQTRHRTALSATGLQPIWQVGRCQEPFRS